MRGHNDPTLGPPIRFVSVGSAASGLASIASAALRNSDLELLGSGIGNLPRGALQETLPKIWALARTGALPVDVQPVPLAEITAAWTEPEMGGLRRVVVP